MKLLNILLIGVVILFTTSCASIVSKKAYNVTFSSVPSSAKVEIINRNGKSVYQGTSPCTVYLSARAGFFRRAIYNVKFSKDGYKSFDYVLKADIDGWYFGNLLFGGLIGFLIVDPATGAMYKISDTMVTIALEEVSDPSARLQIMDINDIPADWHDRLELVGYGN